MNNEPSAVLCSDAADQNTLDRPKKPPTITPRRFTRFFTPRLSTRRANSVRTSRKALQDITKPALNRQEAGIVDVSFDNICDPQRRKNHTFSKKRKLSTSSIDPPLQSSPIRRVTFYPSSSQEEETKADAASHPDVFRDDNEDFEQESIPGHGRSKVQTYGNFGTSASILTSRIYNGPSRQRPDIRTRYENETESFYSTAKDAHHCFNSTTTYWTMPFSTASCNTNSLVAIGDEEGVIKLFDSARDDKTGFTSPFLSFPAHDNAVLDLQFSDDDALLATASGDQTSLVIDMQSQRTIACLSGQTASLKQVKFQPASNNKILATCGRDGDICIWDLRCHEAAQLSRINNCHLIEQLQNSTSNRPRLHSPINRIRNGHASFRHRKNTPTPKSGNKSNHSRGDISVTSLCFLPTHPHLFLTASESAATIKLWDLRASYQTRHRQRPLPLSTTLPPSHHNTLRPYGLTSVSVSPTGSRFYASCRDHTVYAYSTSHLILGSGSELSTSSSSHSIAPPRRFGGPDDESLFPIYGFRHPNLNISTFYIKSTIRAPSASNPTSELLALGSSDNCPILFPTDERYIRDPFLRRAAIKRGERHGLPIYNHGTPLVGGHGKEVTALTWTYEGSLVSVSDDFHARCWREGNEGQARELRTGGEAGGKRWMAGWADVDETVDDDD